MKGACREEGTVITELGFEFSRHVIAMLSVIGAHTVVEWMTGRQVLALVAMWGVIAGEWAIGMIPGWGAAVLVVFSLLFCGLILTEVRTPNE